MKGSFRQVYPSVNEYPVVRDRMYIHEDNRGYFNANLLDHRFVQDNESYSKYGVIRGLHYQVAPYEQVKLLWVVYGKILDITVNLKTKEVFSVELSSDNKKQIYIPAGFAHGFSVLSDDAVVLYKVSNYYNKESERGIRYNDPSLNIDWLIPDDKIIISDKDKNLPFL